jgi:hypothetical protein
VDTRSRSLFIVLILAQAGHALEEYAFRLYDVFAPARAVSSRVVEDPAAGFIIVNSCLLIFGLWCYLARVRRGHPSAKGWVWFWIVLELGNGVGHLVLALSRGGYFPGMITAPLLIVVSVMLGRRLIRFERHQGRPAQGVHGDGRGFAGPGGQGA